MFVLWMALWAAFAVAVARGLVAAAAPLGGPRLASAEPWPRSRSGLAFYAISGIWTRHRAGGPDYPYNFALLDDRVPARFPALLVRHTKVDPLRA